MKQTYLPGVCLGDVLEEEVCHVGGMTAHLGKALVAGLAASEVVHGQIGRALQASGEDGYDVRCAGWCGGGGEEGKQSLDELHA